MITFVTAFFMPSTEYRTSETYFSMFDCLASTNLPIILFLDEKLNDRVEHLRAYPNVQIRLSTLDKSWLPETEFVLPEKRNHKKDTIDYFFIQLSKLRHLSTASEMATTSHLAWIDFGIFHMFKNTTRAQQLLQEISTMELPVNRVFSPSCWVYEKPLSKLVRDNAIWNHCGSFMVGDRTLFPDFYKRQNDLVLQHLPSFTWEVNYWAAMDGFTPYKANHNETILSGLVDYINTKNIMNRIDRVFLINLHDRLIEFMQECEKMNIPPSHVERFTAIDRPEHLALGCTLSHLAVIKLAKEKGYQNVLIFEDDFTFEVNRDILNQRLAHFFNQSIPFKALMLTYHLYDTHPPSRHDDVLSTISYAANASAYLVNQSCYDELIEHLSYGADMLERTRQHWYYINDQIWRGSMEKGGWFIFNQRIGKKRDKCDSYPEIEQSA
jgi:glycosyl transferase family 25